VIRIWGNMGQISPLRSMPKCPWSLDNVGKICHLRGYWQNPSNMPHIWIYVEQSGLRWRIMEDMSHYMYIYLHIH